MSGFSTCFIILDIWLGFEYDSDIKYGRILKSCNNIIIVTNVIILEFLSDRFVHPDTLQLTIFLHELEHKISES